MLTVAIVGCGKIADSHAAQIKRIRSAELVAVCDREPLMARQLQERFNVARMFTDVKDLLRDTTPDVVHITTPPQSHFALAKQCLEAAANVYLEKPFTLYAAEAEMLFELAERVNRRIVAGHDDQFRHAARRMRRLIADGFLGGPPVHMESYYCYELGNSGYAKALVSDKQHWVRQLPGGLLQNIISHGIARIAEFLTSDSPEVIAHGFTSTAFGEMGETELIDELRVIISGGRQTAYFTFSSQMRPSLHHFRIFGPKNGIQIDQDNETMVTLQGKRRQSYLEQFVPPLVFARQYASQFAANVSCFLNSDFHPKAGMKYLIESFYNSIIKNSDVPISKREILLTAKIMESIFRQLRPGSKDISSAERAAVPCPY
jgi:predicted dehydrogenase